MEPLQLQRCLLMFGRLGLPHRDSLQQISVNQPPFPGAPLSGADWCSDFSLEGLSEGAGKGRLSAATAYPIPALRTAATPLSSDRDLRRRRSGLPLPLVRSALGRRPVRAARGLTHRQCRGLRFLMLVEPASLAAKRPLPGDVDHFAIRFEVTSLQPPHYERVRPNKARRELDA